MSGLNQPEFLGSIKNQGIIAIDPGCQFVQVESFGVSQQMPPESPTFHEAVEQVYFKISRALPPSIDFSLTVSRSAQEMFGNHALLERVIESLVKHSRKCLPVGGHIDVTTEDVDFHRLPSDASAGRYVRLYVSCWGTGLNPDNILQQEEQRSEQITLNLRIADLASAVRALNGTVRTLFRNGRLIFDVVLRLGQHTSLDRPLAKLPVILLLRTDTKAAANLGESLASLNHLILHASSPEDLLQLSETYNADIDVLVLPESPFRIHSRTVNTFLLERPSTSVLLFADTENAPSSSVWPIARKVITVGRPFSTQMLVKEVERLLEDQSPPWMTDHLM